MKVRRGEVWHGLRIASHVPFYPSSADYEQVLVPLTIGGVDEIREAEAAVVAFVREGGRVVADPAETDEALFNAWQRKRHGIIVETTTGTRWHWDEDRLRWVLAEVAGRVATEEDRLAHSGDEPREIPRPHLSPR